jgi:hypothetical protein
MISILLRPLCHLRYQRKGRKSRKSRRREEKGNTMHFQRLSDPNFLSTEDEHFTMRYMVRLLVVCLTFLFQNSTCHCFILLAMDTAA